ncbi:DNA cytosine methyltransferase [Nitriliruptoraceae bacterium ZYF776]|nr:DNA cytosine methyltransferase [Profundirhabdus halotolerans]
MSRASTTDAPVCIDLFAGAGGLAEGLMKAGIRVAASVELHPQAGLTHAFNHPDTNVLVGDIRELSLDVLDRAVREATGDSRVDLVVGGPPCQGFSSAGKKTESDPRNSLFRHFVRVIEHTRPRVFLMENVPGFKSRYGGSIYDEAVEAFSGLGYQTVDAIVAARDFGVPQRRKRFVMVGWLAGEADPFEWPAATHHEVPQPTLLAEGGSALVSAGEALSDIAFLEPGYEATQHVAEPTSHFQRQRRTGDFGHLFNHLATEHRAKAVQTFKLIEPGKGIRDVPLELRGTKKLTMARLSPERVANTIVSLPDDLLHYAHHRNLTVRECARLQTFDDDFVFVGKRTSGFVERRVDVPQYTQVGNAVPPLLGEALGRALLRSLGAPVTDLRPIAARRERHRLVCGSSAYAGYTLAPDAKREIRLHTVYGDLLDLPITDSDRPVLDQPPLDYWKGRPNPRQGQWAPGIEPRANPSWMA